MVALFKDLSLRPSLMKCSIDIADTEEKLRALRTQIAATLGISSFDYKTVSGMPVGVPLPLSSLAVEPVQSHRCAITKVGKSWSLFVGYVFGPTRCRMT